MGIELYIGISYNKGNYILNFFLFFLLHNTILSACRYVSSTAPTVLPIRKAPLVLVYDPLDNHKIAFGVVHFALRCFPRWCARLTGSVLPTHARARWRLHRLGAIIALQAILCAHSNACAIIVILTFIAHIAAQSAALK